MVPEEITINIIIYLGPEYIKMIGLSKEFKCLIKNHETSILRQVLKKYDKFIKFYEGFMYSYKFDVVYDSLKKYDTTYDSFKTYHEGKSNILTKTCFYLYLGCPEHIKEEERKILLNPINESRLNKVIRKICSISATLYNQPKSLDYLKRVEGTLNKECVQTAIENGIDVNLKYLIENNCKQNSFNSVNIAVKYGRLDTLIYLRESGCRLNCETLNNEVVYVHFNIIKYLIENGYMINHRVCKLAAKYNRLDCLKYIHENYCIKTN